MFIKEPNGSSPEGRRIGWGLRGASIFFKAWISSGEDTEDGSRTLVPH
jgi:hypothetical protein